MKKLAGVILSTALAVGGGEYWIPTNGKMKSGNTFSAAAAKEYGIRTGKRVNGKTKLVIKVAVPCLFLSKADFPRSDWKRVGPFTVEVYDVADDSGRFALGVIKEKPTEKKMWDVFGNGYNCKEFPNMEWWKAYRWTGSKWSQVGSGEFRIEK